MEMEPHMIRVTDDAAHQVIGRRLVVQHVMPDVHTELAGEQNRAIAVCRQVSASRSATAC